jgi:signal peptidase II
MRAVPFRRAGMFFLIAGLGCTADLLTKSWMFDWLGVPAPGNGRVEWVWQDVVGFQTSLNPGALFGVAQGWWPLFTGLSILAVMGILIWLFCGKVLHDRLLTIALACVTAGILGNLYDRLGLPSYPDGLKIHAVRDYLLVMIGSYHWPNFNIADSLLVCGAGLLIWHSTRKKETVPAEIPCSTNSP